MRSSQMVRKSDSECMLNIIILYVKAKLREVVRGGGG
jgi:hypothetical protein